MNICEIEETVINGRESRTCSNCGIDVTEITQWVEYNYCPFCGAKVVNKKEKLPKINTYKITFMYQDDYDWIEDNIEYVMAISKEVAWNILVNKYEGNLISPNELNVKIKKQHIEIVKPENGLILETNR